jgi:hypothetical protein
MAAIDDAPGEARAANPVPKAVESAALGQMEAVNPAPMAVESDDAGETEAIHQTANRERWRAESGDAGETEATVVRMAPAAGNGAHGETEGIRRTANRERLTDLGEPGRAVAASGAIGQAEALSPAPMERAIAPRHRPRRFKKGRGASSGCSAPTTRHNIA